MNTSVEEATAVQNATVSVFFPIKKKKKTQLDAHIETSNQLLLGRSALCMTALRTPSVSKYVFVCMCV